MENIHTNKPNYGHSEAMGPELRALVEKQLLADLKHYKIELPNLKFDWSNSLVEGHSANYLDGMVENYSGILVLNENNQIVADGWMDFIMEPGFFLAYWAHITTREGKKKLAEKQMPGIPKHVWKQIPEELKAKYKGKRM